MGHTAVTTRTGRSLAAGGEPLTRIGYGSENLGSGGMFGTLRAVTQGCKGHRGPDSLKDLDPPHRLLTSPRDPTTEPASFLPEDLE